MGIKEIFELRAYADDIGIIYLAIVLVASVVVKYTPTIKDNEMLLKIIKFLSKWVALDRQIKDSKIRKDLEKQIKKGKKE